MTDQSQVDVKLYAVRETLEKIGYLYKDSLFFFHNWIIGINSGGVVAALTFMATNTSSSNSSLVLWTLRFFAFGIISSLLWALVNLISALLWMQHLKGVADCISEGTEPKPIPLTRSSRLNISAWILGILSSLLLVGGIVCGLCFINKLHSYEKPYSAVKLPEKQMGAI